MCTSIVQFAGYNMHLKCEVCRVKYGVQYVMKQSNLRITQTNDLMFENMAQEMPLKQQQWAKIGKYIPLVVRKL